MTASDRRAAAGNGAERLRDHLLEAMAYAGTSLTTAELRRLLERSFPGIVSEAVYRSLVILEHRGRVRRLQTPTKHVAWERTAEAALATPRPEPPRRGHDVIADHRPSQR